MKAIFLALCCFGFVLSAHAAAPVAAATDLQVDASARASNEMISRLNSQIHALKKVARPARSAASAIAVGDASSNLDGFLRCDPSRPEPTTCVPHCTVRYSNGTCGSYGQDFCGENASCVANCTVRYSNGTCGSYGADVCGAYASCSENCTVRYSNGTCGSYGPDICN